MAAAPQPARPSSSGTSTATRPKRSAGRTINQSAPITTPFRRARTTVRGDCICEGTPGVWIAQNASAPTTAGHADERRLGADVLGDGAERRGRATRRRWLRRSRSRASRRAATTASRRRARRGRRPTRARCPCLAGAARRRGRARCLQSRTRGSRGPSRRGRRERPAWARSARPRNRSGSRQARPRPA